VCAPVVGNVLVFSDRHHLTWPYSQSTAPFLEPLLLQANKVLAQLPGYRYLATAGPYACSSPLLVTAAA
jgi:hypothetical protein